ERNTREMQENVMRIRMLPISFVFQRFPRLVHDLSGKLDKKIDLVLSGESTELDKTVMEKIGDPLVHLVRNSLDHGIEKPETRIAAGKPETGEIHLNAYHEGGNIVIEITDDGAGLNLEKILSKAKSSGLVSDNDNLSDEEIADLIFRPGFSTADVVSDVSGRGVGMDVVRRNIRALGGTVDVKTKAGKGSVFTIRLPLTLAILDGQSVVVGEEVYIVPLVAIMESIQVDTSLVSGITGQAEVYRLRDEYIPIVKLCNIFNVKPLHENMEDGLLVVVEAEGKKVALLVDDLLGQQQVVIKSLETNFKSIEGISGATILGDGTVALILDVTGLITISKKNTKTINNNTTTSVAA
ncbi:MAG: chemotaxis protein CheA, partial [Gammaproteobacteria bacterium]|nr:chemotaxis protein CheA [Gammaproteobacteria bacterium]